MVTHKEVLELRRREMLHKKWKEQVHRPISQQISREINGPNYAELASRKRELYRDYLEHVNRKVKKIGFFSAHTVMVSMHC